MAITFTAPTLGSMAWGTQVNDALTAIKTTGDSDIALKAPLAGAVFTGAVTLPSPVINTTATGTGVTIAGEASKLVKVDTYGDIKLANTKVLNTAGTASYILLSGGDVAGAADGASLALSGSTRPTYGGNADVYASKFSVSTILAALKFEFDTSTGDMVIAGSNATKASGTTWANPSDIRLKKDIVPYNKGLVEILKLNPVYFKYNGNNGITNNEIQKGFIAQEVEEVFPECIKEVNGYLTDKEEIIKIKVLDTSEINVALVKAIQELEVRIKTLESKNI